MKRVILLVLILGLIPTTAGINLRGGDIYLVRPDSPFIDHGYVPPEYLSVEDLVFYTCIEEKNLPVKSTVICLDDNSFKDINLVRWEEEDNCYIGSYNLDGKDCREMIIQSEYVKDEEIVTLQRDIRVNRLSSILDLVTRNQYSDGGWKDEVHSAAGIWVLSYFEEIFDDELAMGIDWLKLNRDNDAKCWPQNGCSVKTTAKIMAYLTLSGLNDTYRVIHDGNIYLEHMHNFYLEDDEWNLTLHPFESGNTSCVISYENLLNQGNFSFEEDDVVVYTITPVPDKELIVICDQNFKGNLTAADKEQVFIYEGDNLTYTTPNNCWSNDAKWGACDLATTLFACMSNISTENRELALEYLESELRTERSGEQSIGPRRNITESAIYSYLLDNDDIIAWLRYRQNNEGSWGNGTDMGNVLPTGYALLGLLNRGFNRTNEVIEDAEEWVNEREVDFTLNLTSEYAAWNSTEKNALAFIVLKNNARPIVKTNPLVLMIDRESIELEIYNPTTFELADVSFEFSENLEDVLEIEEEDYIPSYSYIKQTVTKTKAETGNIYGYLYIHNFDKELGKVPVMITNFPKIEITSESEDLLVFGKSTQTNFVISKTGHNFDCTLSWEDDDISSKEDYTITSSSLSVDLTFDSAERVEKTYKGTFDCVSGDYTFELPISQRISRYSEFPFSVSPSTVIVNESGQNSFFIVENKLDESLDIEMKFLKSSEDFELEQTNAGIDPNNKVNISIFNNVRPNSNVTQTNVIEVTALDQKKNVNFRAMIISDPPKSMNPAIKWLIIAILLSIIGVGGFFGYKYKDFLLNLVKKGSNIDEIKIKIKKMEQKEKRTAIMNMVNILRILKKDDVQIRGRLKTEGFTEKEVDDALSQDTTDEEQEGGAEDVFSS